MSTETSSAVMTTTEVAHRLIELIKAGQNEQVYTELFSDDAVAIEPDQAPVKETKGKEALIEKHKAFQATITEFFGSGISEPLVAGDYITLTMWIDATSNGQRMKMDEVCLYHVKDGKIISEQFFF
ncbi:MAG: SnoaL-like domain-containing protein [Flavobacteriales bacterium]